MEILRRIATNNAVQFGLLFAVGAGLRFLPHAPNFTAVGAIALFGGVLLGRRQAVLLPLAIMVFSDMVIGFYPGIIYTWIAFVSVALLGMAFRRAPLLSRVFAGGVGGSVLFFIISNVGVWLAGGIYPPTLAGLVDCFVMAVPFFGATLASGVLYGALLFGGLSLAEHSRFNRGRIGPMPFKRDEAFVVEYTYV